MVLRLDDVQVTPSGSSTLSPDEEQIVQVGVDGGETTVLAQQPVSQRGHSSVEIIDGEPPRATPETLWLGVLRRRDLRLRKPLLLSITQEGEHVAVWSELLDEIGYGPYLTAAIEDFQQTMAELYLSLKTEQGNLGPEMARLWQVIRDLIEERP
jgi:hypothetical protein